MSEQDPHTSKKWLIRSGYVLGGLLLFLILLRLSLMTRPVLNFAKNKVVGLINEQLNAKLSVQDLQGDLWKKIILTDIRLQEDGKNEAAASIDTLSISYSLPSLLGEAFEISELRIIGPYVQIEQQDSSWNAARWAKETEPDTEKEENSAFMFRISELYLDKGQILFSAPDLLPDDRLRIEGLKTTGSIALLEEPEIVIREFEAGILEGRLPERIGITFSGDYTGEKVTMDQLVLNSGRTILQSRGSYGTGNGDVDLNSEAEPLDLNDIGVFLDDPVPDARLQMELKVGGSLSDLRTELSTRGPGVSQLKLTARANVRDTLILREASVSSGPLDLFALTSDINAALDTLYLSMNGNVSSNWADSELSLKGSAANLQYENYRLPALTLQGNMRSGRAALEAVIDPGGSGSITVKPEIRSLSTEDPNWTINMLISDLDLSAIEGMELPESKIYLRGQAEGKGFSPGQEYWTYRINTPDTAAQTQNPYTLSGQDFRHASVQGKISVDSLFTDLSFLIDESSADISVSLTDYMTDLPAWSYKIRSREFDLSELAGLDSLPSRLNIVAEGSGAGFEPSQIRSGGELLIEKSSLGYRDLDLLKCSTEIADGILTIPSGELSGEIAEGTFNLRKNLIMEVDPLNRLTADFRIKDISPFAALTGVNQLSASGRLKADVRENDDGQLQFSGDMDLQEIIYGDQFSASEVVGNAVIRATDPILYKFDLSVGAPEISGVPFQDLDFRAEGNYKEPEIRSKFELDLISDAGTINQAGDLNYSTLDQSAQIEWSRLDIRTDERDLLLDKNFNVSLQEGVVRSDTLQLVSQDGSYLRSFVAHADSVEQDVWLEGLGFDFGVLQELITGQRYVDGILSGELTFKRDRESLTSYARLQIDEIRYEGINLDKLQLILDIGKGRAVADGGIWLEGEKKIIGELDAPFTLSPPEAIENSFFDAGVEGSFSINQVDLSFMKSFLDSLGYSNTTGILNFYGSLSGTADAPLMTGALELSEPKLSGIPVDSVLMDFKYEHEQQQIVSNASVIATGQKAVDIDAVVPFGLSLPAFKVTTPGEEDMLDLRLVTNNFNLAVFNDFLNRDYTRQLKGYLNASLDLEGSIGQMEPSGQIRLSEGELSIPPAGISLKNITSELIFTDEGLRIDTFSMNSSSGSFTAGGNIALEGILPTDLDLRFRAADLMLANTRTQNLTVNANGTVKGDTDNPVVGGKVSVRNGFIFLDNFGEKNLETIVLEDEEEASFSLYDSLAIEMELDISDNFYVRNSRYLDMEIELSGDLELQKDHGGELQLFGPVSAIDGYVRPLGKRFDLTEGDIVFNGPIEDPDLSIKTRYVPPAPEVDEIRYIISGTGQDPQFSFESEPFMEQQDVVCYTFFGKPCNALDSWQQVFSGEGGNSAAVNLFAEVLLDEIETLATQELGIDVVQIDNTRSGSETGTSIKTGWYLNRRTFFAIINEITNARPQILFLLEYMINKRLDLIITQGDRLREGVDLRWQFDY